MCIALIDAGTEVDVRDNTGVTPFVHAFNGGHSTIRLLLERGSDDNPLRSAVTHSDLELIRLFLSYDADYNQLDKDGFTLLYYCNGENSSEIAELLIKKGIDVQNKSYVGWTAIHQAAKRKDVRLLRTILSHDSKDKVNFVSKGVTPLHIAVSQQDTAFARALIKAGADLSNILGLDDQDINDKFSFIMSIINEGTINIKLPLEIGANVNLSDPNIYIKDNAELVKRVIHDRKERQDNPITPNPKSLFTAAKYNAVNCVQLLINAGVNPNAKDHNYQTPLWGALNYNYNRMAIGPLQDQSAVANLLIANGANPDQTEKGGHNLLCFSCAHQADWMVSLLLEAGVSANSIQHGKSALYYAVAKGDIKIAKMLIDYGADASYVDDDGMTLLKYAHEAGGTEMAELLWKAMIGR